MAGKDVTLSIASKFDPKGVSQAQSSLGGLGKFATGVGKTLGAAFAVGAAGALTFLGASIKAAAESESVFRGLQNAVDNAGNFDNAVGGIKAVSDALDEASKKLGELSGIDDETINGIKTAWLAVPAIAGMGIKGINDLAVTAANVAAGTGKDIQAVANSFAKAFENPETALAKLQRAGIFVSDSQAAVYQSLVETGDAAGAQAYLVEQLGAKYAGAAEAAANPFDRLKVIFENLMETVGTALMPAIQAIVPIISDFITKLTASPEFEAFLTQLAAAFGTLLDAVLPILDPLMQLIMAILPPLMDIITALAPIIGQLIEAFVPLIESILPPLMSLIDGLIPVFGVLVNDLITPMIPIIQGLFDAFAPIINAAMPIFKDLIEALVPILMSLMETLVPIIEQILPVFQQIMEALWPSVVKLFDSLSPIVDAVLPMFSNAMTLLMPIIQLVVDLLTGPLSFALDTISGIFQLLTGDFEGAGETFKSVFEGMASFGKTIVNDIIGIFEGMINFVIGGINNMIDFFNSIKVDIPDWVPVIGGQTLGLNIPRLGSVSIPRLAEGGTVTNPGLTMVGEQGPEFLSLPMGAQVTPLDKTGGSTYNITINGANMTPDQIVSALKRFERSNGPVYARA